MTVPDFPWPDFHGEAITVQDCWRARRNPGLMHAVRQCLQRMNIHPVEIEENFEKTTFDGMWRFSEAPIRRNIGIAPKYFSEVRDHGIELLPPNEQEERMKAMGRAISDPPCGHLLQCMSYRRKNRRGRRRSSYGASDITNIS